MASVVCESCRKPLVDDQALCVHANGNCGRVFHVKCVQARLEMTGYGYCDCRRAVKKTDFVHFVLRCFRSGEQLSARLLSPETEKACSSSAGQNPSPSGACQRELEAALETMRQKLAAAEAANFRLRAEKAVAEMSVTGAKELLHKRNTDLKSKDEKIVAAERRIKELEKENAALLTRIVDERKAPDRLHRPKGPDVEVAASPVVSSWRTVNELSEPMTKDVRAQISMAMPKIGINSDDVVGANSGNACEAASDALMPIQEKIENRVNELPMGSALKNGVDGELNDGVEAEVSKAGRGTAQESAASGRIEEIIQNEFGLMEEASEEDSSGTESAIAVNHTLKRGARPLTKTLMRVGGDWRHKEEAVGGRILRPRLPSVRQCTECKKFFGTNGYLPAHECVVHAKKKKRKRFACDVCEMSSAWKSNLNRHQRMLHGGSHVASMHGVGSASSARESMLTMLLRGRREATERRTREVKKQSVSDWAWTAENDESPASRID